MSDEAFYMLNALWFKAEGGAERYQEYLAAAGPIVARHGGGLAGDAYIPEEAFIGEFDADLVFFVRWPSMEAFTAFVNDPEYAPVRDIREEAITNSLLVKCRMR